MEVDAKDILEKDLAIQTSYMEFAKTEAGKKIISDLENNVYTALQYLFSITHKDPDFDKIFSAVTVLQNNSAILKKFTGAKEEAKQILDTLKGE